MDLSLNGKRALITGSSAGIGEATARRLASEGAHVMVHGLTLPEAEEVAHSIVKAGGKAYATSGDLRSDIAAETIVRDTLKALDQVDILANIAGAYPWNGWFVCPPDEWIDVYNTDVVSCVRMIYKLVPQMKSLGWGRVITMSSASGTYTPANYVPAYSSAKAAVTAMSKSLAIELAGSGITVNAISPAPVSTETTRRLFTNFAAAEGRSTRWEDVERHFVDTVMHEPLVSRMATPEEVAALVAFLCSSYADPISGAEYLIDCGYSITGFRPIPSGI
jgi:NAD(P)-dependent dehydrogenase (short-subunit alcohol dehydrogenase family)